MSGERVAEGVDRLRASVRLSMETESSEGSLSMRRATLALVLSLAMVSPLALPVSPAAGQEPLFTRVEAFTTKTGFRAVFAWQATEPVAVTVEYGTDPDNLDRVAGFLPTSPDTAGVAFADLREDLEDTSWTGETFHYRLVDERTGTATEIRSLVAENAYLDHDETGYTLDLVVQLDSEELPPDIPADQALSDIAQGISVMAERTYDAFDGDARVGKVLVTDTNLDHAANIPFQPVTCETEGTNLADVLVQTSVPFDSHTFRGAVENSCLQINLGRIGQLVVPWEDDLHFGYTAAHELMHYAFFAPDLYPAASDADCRNLDWDGSLMHNTGGWNGAEWILSELDRSPDVTPCEHGTEPWTWDEARGDTDGDGTVDTPRYAELPPSDTPPEDGDEDLRARGAEDGGALDIMVLDREPGSSTLTTFTPDDDPGPTFGVECTATGPQVVDPAGDATGLAVEGAFLPNEPSLDVLEGRFTWDPDSEALTAHIVVDDLVDTPPPGALGRYFRYGFTHDGTSYTFVLARDLLGEEFRLVDNSQGATGTTIVDGLEGSFDAEADEVTVTLPAAEFAAAKPDADPIVEGTVLDGFSILAQRYVGVLTLTADAAGGACEYEVGQENP